ncbi:unnamed protein product [Caenorhabditis brenneri]
MHLQLALLIVLASVANVVVSMPPEDIDSNPPAFGELLNLKPPGIATTTSSSFYHPPWFSSSAQYLNGIALIVAACTFLMTILCYNACVVVFKNGFLRSKGPPTYHFKELSGSDDVV